MIATQKIEVIKTSQSRLKEVNWEDLGFGKIFSDHMAVIEYRDGQWMNAQIRPYGPMQFSPAISALHYGQAIFEGLKAFKSANDEVFIFRPEKNAERLNESARRMCMPELPVDLFMESLTQLIKFDSGWIPKGEGESLYIRPHMFAIDEYVGVRPSETYMFVIFTGPVGKYYTAELKVKIETNYTRAVRGGTGHAKAAGNLSGVPCLGMVVGEHRGKPHHCRWSNPWVKLQLVPLKKTADELVAPDHAVAIPCCKVAQWKSTAKP